MNIRCFTRFARFHLSIGLLLSAGICARGAALSWDTVPGDGGAITPGSGAWATGAGNWNNGTTNANWANGDTATFGGADGAYTIDVTGTISLGSGAALSFTNSGYTLSAVTATNAQTISAANKVISVSPGKTATIGTNVTLARNAGSSSSRDIAFSGGGTFIIDAGGVVSQSNGNASEIGSGTTVRLTGGNLSLLTSLVIGRLDSTVTANGQLIVDSGVITIGGTGGLIPGRTAGEVSVLTINGGSVIVDGGQVRTDNGTATINLNGGVVSTRQVARAGGTSALTFNGGTLKVSSSAPAAQKADFISSLTSATINNGGATIDPNGQAITIGQALLAGAGTGGLTVNDTAVTKGSLTLSGANTYTGPTTINAGKLEVVPPYNSLGSSVVVNSGGRLRATANASSSEIPPLTLNDGGGIEFNLGTYNSANVPALTNASLILPNGTTNFIDIVGTDIPVANIVLLAYTNKTGTGVFKVGTLPAAMDATLTDTGSQLILNVTAPSASLYTWSAGTGDWDIGTSFNWNSSSATYAEPAVVVFPDSPSGTVNLATNVSPFDVDVLVTNAGFYTFTGPGSIDGNTGMDIFGISTVTLGNSNSFSGPVTISGGSGTSGAYVTVTHPHALGATNGGTVVSGPANTLALGSLGGAGTTVHGESVTILGTGVGGAKGALRGSAVAFGETNVWNGPVILGASGARIGAEDGGNLTVSGVITDNGTNFGPVIRPGSGASVTLKGAGNNWGGNTTLFGSDFTSTVIAGVNNAIPTNTALYIGTCTLDLNGFNQTSPLVGLASSGVAASTVVANTAGGLSTLTINGTNNHSFPGDVTGNLAIVKDGSGTQDFTGANVTYTGTTTVNGGRLNLSSPNPMSSSITVGAGGTLGGEFATTGSLTLNANSKIFADPASPGSAQANTVIASSAPVFVGFTTAPPVGVPVLVVSNAAGFTGSAANFQAFGVRGGTFYLTNGNSELMYVAAESSVVLTWKGNDGTNPTFWDVVTTTNWDNGGSPDAFFTGDGVRFDDTATTYAVAIQGSSVAPNSVIVSNLANAYTISGGAIAGAASLVKQGTNSLTLASANSYTGNTIIHGGKVLIGADNRLGAVPASATSSNIVLDSGMLALTAANVVLQTNRSIYLGGAGGALANQVPGNWSILGLVEGPGSLTLDSQAAGANFLMAGNNTHAGGTLITGLPGAYVYPIVSSVGSPGSLVSGPFGTGPVTFNGPGTRSTTASATTVGNAITFAADVAFQTVGSEKTLTFSGPVTLSGGDRTLNVAIGATVSTESLVISGPIGEATPGLALIKAGTGQMISSGTNTYTGNTTVNAGRLVLQQASLATNSTVSVATNAVLQLDFAETNTVAGLVLNGVSQTAGVYDASSSSPYLDGSGALLVVPLSTLPTTGTNIFISAVTSSNLTLSWPSSYTGWYLQSQTNALSTGLSSNWVTIDGSQNTNSVTLPINSTDPTVFFRMVHTNAP